MYIFPLGLNETTASLEGEAAILEGFDLCVLCFVVVGFFFEFAPVSSYFHENISGAVVRLRACLSSVWLVRPRSRSLRAVFRPETAQTGKTKPEPHFARTGSYRERQFPGIGREKTCRFKKTSSATAIDCAHFFLASGTNNFRGLSKLSAVCRNIGQT